MTLRILPYQDGADLVFCFAEDDGTLLRYVSEQLFYGIGKLVIAGPLVTVPTLDLAAEFRMYHDAPDGPSGATVV